MVKPEIEIDEDEQPFVIIRPIPIENGWFDNIDFDSLEETIEPDNVEQNELPEL